MALTLGTAARNAACDAVVDLVDVGGGGKVVIKTAGASVLATIPTAATAFGSASTGIATAASLPLSANASASGTAATYEVQNNAGTVIWSGTVSATGGGGDMQLSTTTITSGQPVSITSWTHTQPA